MWLIASLVRLDCMKIWAYIASALRVFKSGGIWCWKRGRAGHQLTCHAVILITGSGHLFWKPLCRWWLEQLWRRPGSEWLRGHDTGEWGDFCADTAFSLTSLWLLCTHGEEVDMAAWHHHCSEPGTAQGASAKHLAAQPCLYLFGGWSDGDRRVHCGSASLLAHLCRASAERQLLGCLTKLSGKCPT